VETSSSADKECILQDINNKMFLHTVGILLNHLSFGPDFPFISLLLQHLKNVTIPPFGMLRRVSVVRTHVSEGHIASIIRVQESAS
jgi:hypothetical protein